VAFALGLTVTALTFVCFGLLPKSQAVLPAPDGGYPAEGTSALLSLNGGIYNTAVGWFSLKALTSGSFNTAIGAGALPVNTADRNTATGSGALFQNTDGADNTGTGTFALFNNIGGYSNTATGVEALGSNFAGYENTADGVNALVGNTYGARNSATGVEALFSNLIGNYNTAQGFRALHSNYRSYNTAIGAEALYNNTSGGGNIGLGLNAGNNVTTANNVICIGNGSQGANVTGTCFIGNIFGVTTGMDAAPVVVDALGQLGTVASWRRFKRDIQPMDRASETILSLKPVRFHYKNSKTGTPQFGLIAEDVANVSPDLVVQDKDGEIYTGRYDAVNAMLLNEFLKEHRKVEELQTTVAQQQQSFQSRLAEQEKRIEALASGLQKVSDHLQLSKPTPQVVANAVHETLKGPVVTDFCNPN
jgi:trimeric autotransporter adhesin